MNTQVSVAIHILSLLSIEEEPISSKLIAGSINSNPTLVRKICKYLKDGQLIESQQGKAGYKLSKPASEITLGAVYQLIQEEDHFAKIHQDTNPDCIVGRNIQSALNDVYSKVDLKIVEELNQTTLEALATQMTQPVMS
ncbi:Rrf2 family transcriptional regulator [Mammaliicoccus sp. Dog046]|uniref:Rrf2 family transcriptional regulator n=1 Tax=Mammaliicoccus sp. Dog046 TaxID=3034233 RepID=UPI002B257CC9|nr:Rrf2 family transcriptional regulator [Mammaliicoccus sp. Dog046]WQK85180.1 Rrf2 family transcriptional regulator [Mammaliicoccus sp. Dog046]